MHSGPLAFLCNTSSRSPLQGLLDEISSDWQAGAGARSLLPGSMRHSERSMRCTMHYYAPHPCASAPPLNCISMYTPPPHRPQLHRPTIQLRVIAGQNCRDTSSKVTAAHVLQGTTFWKHRRPNYCCKLEPGHHSMGPRSLHQRPAGAHITSPPTTTNPPMQPWLCRASLVLQDNTQSAQHARWHGNFPHRKNRSGQGSARQRPLSSCR
jgi:hypothetical protein